MQNFNLNVVLLVTYIICNVFTLTTAKDFAYNGALGQSQQLETCSGKHPSPIDIETVNVVNKDYRILTFKSFHDLPQNMELLNDGQTLVMRFEYDEALHPSVTNGPLDGKYALEKIQFYWGDNKNYAFGSEDRNSNVSFPTELHFILRNEKYPTFSEASEKNNGVAVLAFFYEILERDNEGYEELVQMLKQIAQPDTAVKFQKPQALWSFIHIDVYDYYTYKGSLLTPPCSVDVTWIDFHEPVHISAKQIESFRHLYAHDNTRMIYNHGPMLKPLHNRTIFDAVLVIDPEDEDYGMHSAIPFVDNLVGGANAIEADGVRLIVQLFVASLLTGWISTNWI